MRFISPTWDRIYSYSISLAEKLQGDQKGNYEAIIGVSRGGLPLTRIMSDLLCVQNVMITRCEYYSDLGETRKHPIITQKIQGNIGGKRVLLLDDVADTGESLIEIKKYLLSLKPRSLTIATLYIKPWTKMIPDYYMSKTSSWIIFPWELLEAVKSISAKSGARTLKQTRIPSKYLRRLMSLNGRSSNSKPSFSYRIARSRAS